VNSALAYLYLHSAKNRTLSRLKRLKQPKYLFGAVVGGLYFYFYFFRFLIMGGRSDRALPAGVVLPDLSIGLEWFGAMIIFMLLALAWLFPKDRAALEFTEAEVAFLFPAPLSRRTLIHFKLLRSQIRILISALFFALFSGRFGGGSFWGHALGWWVVLSAINLHYLGCSFVQSIWFGRGIATWKRRAAAITFLTTLLLAVGWWGRETMRVPRPEDFDGLRAIGNYLRELLASGPMVMILYPFRLLVRPFLAPDAMAMLLALGPALLLLGLHYWWVMRMDVSFEEASLEASQKRAEMLAAVRSGNAALLRPTKNRRQPLFKLSPVGLRVMALLWKNLIVADQTFNLRFWAGTLVVLSTACLVLGTRGQLWEMLPKTAGMVALFLAAYSLLLGPQILRQDLRQDLKVADVLKQYPLSGWQIVLGELLAPAVILTFFQWLLLLVALMFSAYLPVKEGIGVGRYIAILVGAGMIAPALNLLWIQIPNAAVLFFPGWFRTNETQQGMEFTGQRLIMMLGQGLLLTVSLLPAAGAFALVLFLAGMALNLEVGILLGSMLAAVVLAVEAGAGVVYLGRMFERLDLSEEGT
jgi:ABC-2 type transport system permease protein